MSKNFLTQEGLQKAIKEYDFLKQLKKTKISNDAPQAIVSSDADPEYLTFFQDLNLLEVRLARINEIIKNAVIIKPPVHEKTGVVSIGATVEVESQGQVDKIKIVGSVEADPGDGKISCTSPVGSALIGHRAGDKIQIMAPLKTLYRILTVKYQMS